MESKQISIGGKLYGVCSHQDYINNQELYNNYYTAVEIKLEDDRNVVLPVRSPLDSQPGIYVKGSIAEYVIPDENDVQYAADNIVDLTNTKTMDELLDKQSQIRDIEREILTNPDSITVPNISNLDTPLMRGLKEAIIAKQIDINKYEDRFGPNFPNDKRSLRDHKVTLKMFCRAAKNLDMKATLIIEDASSDAPNPMGKPIVVDLISGDDKDDE